MKARQFNKRHQSGVALILVLWVVMLITVVTGTYAAMARMEQLEAYTLLGSTQARFAAEAGLNIAVAQLRDPNEDSRWLADGRPYILNFDGTLLEIHVTDERGKLDINSAGQEQLYNLFSGHGLDEAEAVALAESVEDWRDPDNLPRPNGAELSDYEAAGLAFGPGDRPFIAVEEVIQVFGMPYELYRQIEPGLTIYSRGRSINPMFAPVESLLSLGWSMEDAQNFVAERDSQDPAVGDLLETPDGQALPLARGRGVTYSIRVKATMPNGIWDQIETTIRLGGDPMGRPYRILRWAEGFQK